MSNIARRQRSSVLAGIKSDRAIGQALAVIQTGAYLERASDEVRRNLALGRMSDIGMATRHGIDEGAEIVGDMCARIERDPVSAGAVSKIAETGIRGLDRVLRQLTEES